MARVLVLLSLWACSYAQLIYPDQYEQMKTASTPAYAPPTIDRQSQVDPSYFRTSGGASSSRSVPAIAGQNSPQSVGALTSGTFQQTASTVPAGYGNMPVMLVDWSNHVNSIIVRGVTKFALDMEREIDRSRSAMSPGQRDNVVFSPLNIAMTLAMVLLGSAGRTFDEVSRVLGLESGVDISRHSEIVHQMFGILLKQVDERMAGSPGPRVDFASAVYVQDGYSIRPEFKAISENVYRSEVINLDFFRKGQEARDTINAWVKQKTMGKISGILNDVPPPETNVILISALYFKGEWNQHFLPYATKRKPFFIEPNESVDVDMMYNAGQFPFYEDKQLRAKILALPYKGFDISMYVILPTAEGATALRNFQSQLTPDLLESLISKMTNMTCIVALPKMKLSSTLSLVSPLKELGLTSLFNPQAADLSLLSQGYAQQTMPSIVPTVSPLTQPYIRPGKSNTEPTKPVTTNDVIIFPRFGSEEPSNGMRRNYFSYIDKSRGLTVEQWFGGFSIGRTRRVRSQENNKSEKELERNENSYLGKESSADDNMRIVNLEENKYRFEKKKEERRRKRQTRPIDESFLDYIKSQNFPSYGLDDLRNSPNLVNPHLYASDVLHKVEIEITEKGTEAAATTAVLLERDGSQKRLIANRPFLFFIRHNPSKLILFWGKINTPTPNYLVT